MTTYHLPHDQVPLYQGVYITKYMMDNVRRFGLRDPLLWTGTDIYVSDRERWMAFHMLYPGLPVLVQNLEDALRCPMLELPGWLPEDAS